MPAESLVPGYRLVGSFGPDSEYETRPSANTEGDEDGEEVEEEVEYVTLEISGIADVDPGLLTSYRLIGLDTPTPFLQLSSSGTIFKGRHHKLLGTELLFTHLPDDCDPLARNISLLGTTEKRVVFSSVEIRNPASSSSTSKGERSGKESIPPSKKGKKKVNFWANGIQDVAGSLGVGISKPSAPDEQDGAAESDPSTRSKTAGKGKEKEEAAQDDDDDGLYATGEEGVGEEDGGDGTFDADLPPRKKRKSSGNGGGERTFQSPATMMPPVPTTPAPVAGVAQGQHKHGAPPPGSGIIMVIDSALEELHVPDKPQLEPQEVAPESDDPNQSLA